MSNFIISESAAQRLHKIFTKEPEGSKLRIIIEGGGCSGFQYKFDIVTDAPNDDDNVFSGNNGVMVLVDEISMEFLQDSQLDYVEKLGSSTFEINNPNANSSCGCGNSFAV